MFLTPADLVELTGRKRGLAQSDQLREMGIPFVMRDGKPVVLRQFVEQMLGSAKTPVREPELRQ